MRYFIFLTCEGFTKTPHDEDIENLQVVGITKGENEEEALKNLIIEEKSLINFGYDKIFSMELVSENQKYFWLSQVS